MVLIASLVAVRLICNELISILENIGDIGVPLPGFLDQLVSMLKRKVAAQVPEEDEKQSVSLTIFDKISGLKIFSAKKVKVINHKKIAALPIREMPLFYTNLCLLLLLSNTWLFNGGVFLKP